MSLVFFWSFVFLYLLVGEPWARYSTYKRIQLNLRKGRNARIWHYYENIIRYWVVFVFAFFGLSFCGLSLHDAGFRGVNWEHFESQPILLKSLVIVGLCAYFFYYYFIPLVWARLNDKVREDVLEKIKGVQYIAPTNTLERVSWGIYALNGIVEEFLFRGLSFLFVLSILPNLKGVMLAILLGACLEAWRFIPRYFVVINVIFTGLLFSLLYYSFQSLYIGIIIHFLHYLKIFAMPFEKK